MRSFLIVFILFLPTFAFAQNVETLCRECRDVRAYPMDFGNHAFNVTFAQAEDSSSLLGVNVAVRNPLGQSALVYLARVMDYSGLNISFYPFFSYQVPYPSPYVQISVQDAWGTLTVYQVLADTQALIVGGGSEPAEEPDTTDIQAPDKTTGGLDLLGGYDASANYYGGATYPYYDIRLSNE